MYKTFLVFVTIFFFPFFLLFFPHLWWLKGELPLVYQLMVYVPLLRLCFFSSAPVEKRLSFSVAYTNLDSLCDYLKEKIWKKEKKKVFLLLLFNGEEESGENWKRAPVRPKVLLIIAPARVVCVCVSCACAPVE